MLNNNEFLKQGFDPEMCFIFLYFLWMGFQPLKGRSEEKSRAAKSALVMLAASFSTPCFYI